MIEIGYVVRIHDTGHIYDQYDAFFRIYDLEHLKPRFRRLHRPQSLDIIYRVVDIRTHPSVYSENICVLESIETGGIYLCGAGGLTTMRVLPEELYQGIMCEGERSEPETHV